MGSTRERQVPLISPESQTRWLASEIDGLEAVNERDHEELRKSLRTIQATLIGILVSTTTAAILLAINVMIGR